MVYTILSPMYFFCFSKKWNLKVLWSHLGDFSQNFGPFLPFFKKCRKMVNFHFFEKQKIYIGDNIVIKGLHSPPFWKTHFESVTALDARAPIWHIFFNMTAQKICFSWIKIHMYAKNEVSRYKTKKKTFGTVPSPAPLNRTTEKAPAYFIAHILFVLFTILER